MIFCFGHCFPYTDIDSLVGSKLLEFYFNKKGKEAKAVYFNKDAIRKTTFDIYQMTGLDMPEFVEVEDLAREDVEFAMIDHNDILESFGKYGINKEVMLCIDHHTIQGNIKAREIRFKKIGAACSIILDMILEKGYRLTDELARASVIGIVSDTMGLRNVKTSQRDKDLVRHLYENYDIGINFKEIVDRTTKQVKFKNMTTERILSNSLREYFNGRVAIAQIFVLSRDYIDKIEDIVEKGWETKYDLYVFALHIQKEKRSVVYYFDKKYNIFPVTEEYNRVISRSKDLLPHVLNQIRLRSTWE